MKYDTEVAHVKKLIAAAATSQQSDNAMKFAQAALNAANALCSLTNAQKQ